VEGCSQKEGRRTRHVATVRRRIEAILPGRSREGQYVRTKERARKKARYLGRNKKES
jgi:hypothetical protein